VTALILGIARRPVNLLNERSYREIADVLGISETEPKRPWVEPECSFAG